MNKLIAPLLSLAVLSTVIACGSAATDEDVAGAEHDLNDVTVKLGSMSFSPNTVRIVAGAKVTWVNESTNVHTVTSGAPGDDDEGELFDKELRPGQSFTFTFPEEGAFPYFCRPHAMMGMTGLVTVKGTATDAGAGTDARADGGDAGRDSGKDSGRDGGDAGTDSGKDSGVNTNAPTWTEIYTDYFGPNTPGKCAMCHESGNLGLIVGSTKTSMYNAFVSKGFIDTANPAASPLAKTGESPLAWFGGFMPPRATPNPAAVADIKAWLAAGAKND